MSLLSLLRRIARRATLSRSAGDGYEQMDGYAVDPAEPEAADRVRRVQHYGFRSRPGPGTGTEIWALAPEAGASQRVYVASEVKGTGPTDQEDWEVEVYCKNGQRLTLDKDGQVLIRAKGATIKIDSNGAITIDTPAGQDVNIQSGTNGIARELDPVDANTAMRTWMAAVVTAFSTLSGAAGGNVPPITAPGAAPGTFGFIKLGSQKAKCG